MRDTTDAINAHQLLDNSSLGDDDDDDDYP